MFGFSELAPIHAFKTYDQWRHRFMQRRLRLGILFGLLYFVTFLPLDILTYVENRNPFDLLWIITNLVRIVILLFCLGLIRKKEYRPRRVMAVFLLASWSISLLHRFHETYVGLASNTPIAEPDLFSWAISFITQATLIPVGWPLHLISQLWVIVYYFVVNPLLGLQVVTPSVLFAASLLLNIFWICCICNFSVYFYEKLSRENFEANRQLLEAQEKSERLLLNILPRPIAEQLKQSPDIIAENFAEVTVLFADIVNFTQMTESQSATNVVDFLNQVFSRFDQLAENYGLEKIKTIGDAYMVAAGLPQPQENHVVAVAAMAVEMQKTLAEFNAQTGQDISLRIGIHTGPVVAGVIGLKKFAYDLWGDTVNTASRMESHGVPNGIQISEATYQRLKSSSEGYEFQPRGPIVIKGKGAMVTYLMAPCGGDDVA